MPCWRCVKSLSVDAPYPCSNCSGWNNGSDWKYNCKKGWDLRLLAVLRLVRTVTLGVKEKIIKIMSLLVAVHTLHVTVRVVVKVVSGLVYRRWYALCSPLNSCCVIACLLNTCRVNCSNRRLNPVRSPVVLLELLLLVRRRWSVPKTVRTNKLLTSIVMLLTLETYVFITRVLTWKVTGRWSCRFGLYAITLNGRMLLILVKRHWMRWIDVHCVTLLFNVLVSSMVPSWIGTWCVLWDALLLVWTVRMCRLTGNRLLTRWLYTVTCKLLWTRRHSLCLMWVVMIMLLRPRPTHVVNYWTTW